MTTSRSSNTIVTWQYDLIAYFYFTLLRLFYREVGAWGIEELPRNGAVIFLGAPHSNDFCDTGILMPFILSRYARRVSFLAAVGVTKMPFIGALCRRMGATPLKRVWDQTRLGSGTISLPDLTRPQIIRGEGTKFDIECHVGDPIMAVIGRRHILRGTISQICGHDKLVLEKPFLGKQEYLEHFTPGALRNLKYSLMSGTKPPQSWTDVTDALRTNGGICLFPEGASHDQPRLLPIKSGFAVIALKYMAENPGEWVTIVPCGIHHNESHTFRSKIGLEFGLPIEVPDSLFKLYQAGQQSEAASALKKLVQPALHEVTLSHSNDEFAQVVDLMRTLYGNINASLYQKTQLDKELWRIYLRFELDPNFRNILDRIHLFRQKLTLIGLENDYVKSRSKRCTLPLLGLQCLQLTLTLILLLPGLIFFGPLLYLCNDLSQRYAQSLLKNSAFKLMGKDVLASAKVLNAFKFMPFLYTALGMGIFRCVHWSHSRLNMARVMPASLVVVFGLTLVSIFGIVSISAWDLIVDLLHSIRVSLIFADPRKAALLESIREQGGELELDMQRYMIGSS